MSAVAEHANTPDADYDTDSHAWALAQAALLRARRFDALDVDNLIEEIEDMARRDRDELYSRLEVLLIHLLKWRYQPARQGTSWRATIGEQRRRLARLLKTRPSLKPLLADYALEAYTDARQGAADETGLAVKTFPETCEWSVEQTLDSEWFPEPAPDA